MTGRLVRAAGIALITSLILFSITACGEIAAGFGDQRADTEYHSNKLKLLAADNGVYRVSAGALAAGGLAVPQTLSHDAVSLTDGTNSVPFLIDGDTLVFYGQESHDRYYGERPYILELGKPGLAMDVKTAAPVEGPGLKQVRQTVRLEENNIYVSEARLAEESDVWFWSKLPQQDAFTAEVVLPFVEQGEGKLRFDAWGFTHNPQVENDHDLKIKVNDIDAGLAVWDGQSGHTAEIALPDDLLHSGVNKVTLDNRDEGASFLDIVQINWLEIDYFAPPTVLNDRLTFRTEDGIVPISGLSGAPVVLDISDATRPLHLTEWQYDNGAVSLAVTEGPQIAVTGPRGFLELRLEPVTKSDWKSNTLQADLIIITADELVPALAPLVKAREAEGLSVAVVPVQEIYDAFGHGAPSPESIRTFVKHAYQNWQKPQPRYLLLVGDATTDYRGYVSEVPQNTIPSPMVMVQFSGETVSDSRTADVDDDMRPDLAVGRWPVQTPQEVSELVARTLAYEESAASERSIFATDGSEGAFSSIANHLIDDALLERDNVDHRDGPTAAEFNEMWRQGAWLATYIGHGSIDRWGKDNVFNLDEVRKLKGDAIPIVVQLTCLTGLFSHPEQVSLAEAMLLHPEGPVQIVAASSLTLSAHQAPFAVELLKQFQEDGTPRIGDAFLGAKRSLDVDASEGLREISDTFALFGDPSAKIVRPQPAG